MQYEDSTAVALSYGPYGGGHGHPDKLSVAVYAQGRQWIAQCSELMLFLQREIERWRCRDCVLRVTDERGQPLAGAAVAVYQVASDFVVGARWSPEENVTDFARYAERVARWGTHLLTSVPPPPELLAPCHVQGL